MLTELNAFATLGYLGGILFFGSWLLQAYETRRSGKVTVSLRFFIIRALASVLLVVESVRVESLSLLLVNGLTCLLMFYNIFVCSRQLRQQKEQET